MLPAETLVVGALPPQLVADVTAADIADGTRGNACYCPIARAICRALDEAPGGGAVAVDWDDVDVWVGWEHGTYDLDETGKRWIQAYDDGADMAPVTITLTLRTETPE